MNINTILIVEDDKEIRQGVEIFLKGQGYRVLQAENGLEGLKVLEQETVDLAIEMCIRDRYTMKLPPFYRFVSEFPSPHT